MYENLVRGGWYDLEPIEDVSMADCPADILADIMAALDEE